MIKDIFRGDTWDLEYQISDKNDNFLDVTDWEIRCEIKSEKISIKKANNKVNGGSIEQIKVLDDEGNIIIFIKKEETKICNKGVYSLEIEITSSEGKRYTVVKDEIKVEEDDIRWEDKE